ncbi:MAG: hypothetical protein JNN27_23410 [Planctomycetes bacterium]|nr:hypothetical protein [Planctomycetota bacterium]
MPRCDVDCTNGSLPRGVKRSRPALLDELFEPSAPIRATFGPWGNLRLADSASMLHAPTDIGALVRRAFEPVQNARDVAVQLGRSTAERRAQQAEHAATLHRGRQPHLGHALA